MTRLEECQAMAREYVELVRSGPPPGHDIQEASRRLVQMLRHAWRGNEELSQAAARLAVRIIEAK